MQQPQTDEKGLTAINDPGDVGRDEHLAGDRAIVGISNVAAWIYPLLMIAICTQVVIRQAGFNQAWLDDLQWWLYGISSLVGVAYAVTTNSHVRVDIFFALFEKARQHKIDIFGITWCFLPFIMLCWDVTVGYAASSIFADEGSDSPNGLHNLWILKTFMNISFLVTAFALVSIYLRLMKALGDMRLFRLLLWALPSVLFAINLAVYYAIYLFHLAQLPADENARTILRKPIFGHIEFGASEISYTILISLVLTAAVLALAWLRDAARRTQA